MAADGTTVSAEASLLNSYKVHRDFASVDDILKVLKGEIVLSEEDLATRKENALDTIFTDLKRVSPLVINGEVVDVKRYESFSQRRHFLEDNLFKAGCFPKEGDPLKVTEEAFWQTVRYLQQAVYFQLSACARSHQMIDMENSMLLEDKKFPFINKKSLILEASNSGLNIVANHFFRGKRCSLSEFPASNKALHEMNPEERADFLKEYQSFEDAILDVNESYELSYDNGDVQFGISDLSVKQSFCSALSNFSAPSEQIQEEANSEFEKKILMADLDSVVSTICHGISLSQRRFIDSKETKEKKLSLSFICEKIKDSKTFTELQENFIQLARDIFEPLPSKANVFGDTIIGKTFLENLKNNLSLRALLIGDNTLSDEDFIRAVEVAVRGQPLIIERRAQSQERSHKIMAELMPSGNFQDNVSHSSTRTPSPTTTNESLSDDDSPLEKQQGKSESLGSSDKVKERVAHPNSSKKIKDRKDGVDTSVIFGGAGRKF